MITSEMKRLPLIVVGVLTAAVVAAVAAVGDLGYAATTVARTVHVLAAPKVQAAPKAAAVIARISGGSDQYQPGFGFGDPNHIHPGRPRLLLVGRVRTRKLPGRPAVLVTTQFSVDEQAHLYVHVFGPDGRELLLTQNGSLVAGKVTGKQTKTIEYLLLIPRTSTLTLRIPANLLKPGRRYTIKISAVAPTRERGSLDIPFAL
jgi:hypothetical protein